MKSKMYITTGLLALLLMLLANQGKYVHAAVSDCLNGVTSSGSCSYTSTAPNGFKYSGTIYYTWCPSHYGAATACSTGIDQTNNISPGTLSGSWNHIGCGNSWGTFTRTIVDIPADEYGACGTDANGYSATAPSISSPNLCSNGTVDTVRGIEDGYYWWGWTCKSSFAGASGTLGTVNCQLQQAHPGVCGTAAGVVATTTPNKFNSPISQTRMCLAPYGEDALATSVNSGGNVYYSWVCPGQNASGATCTAPRRMKGVCDNSVLNACKLGTYVAGTAPNTWSCAGINGGANTSCSLASPSCGSSNSQSFPSAPTSGLCNTGTASSVTTSGSTYSWACTAPTAPAFSPSTCASGLYLCGNGSVSANCGTTNAVRCTAENYDPVAGYYDNTLPMNCVFTDGVPRAMRCGGNTSVSCSASQAVVEIGQCGTASGGAPVAAFPTTNLCTSSGPAIQQTSNATTFSWRCQGTNAADSGLCSVNRITSSTGGPAQINTLPVTPIVNYRGTCNVNLLGALTNYYVPVPSSAIYPMTYCELKNQYTPGILYAWNSVLGLPPINFSQSNILRDTLYTLQCWDATPTATAPFHATSSPVQRTAACRVNPSTIETN